MTETLLSGDLCELSGFYWPISNKTGRAAEPIVVNEQFPPLDGHFELACTPGQFVNLDLARDLKIETAYRDLLRLAKEALEELPEGVGPAGLYDAVQEGYALMGLT